MIEWIHPGALFFISAALLFFVRGTAKSAILLITPILGFLFLLLAPEGNHGTITFMGQQLTFGKVDRLSLVFGYVFILLTLIGMVYSLHLKGNRESIVAFLYAGSALGVVFAGDLFTLFVFWEIMAFTSVFLVLFGGQPASSAAGMRYLMVHVVGGLCLLGGIIIHGGGGAGFGFSTLPAVGLGPTLILIGFLLNAAVPPLHAWLPDAYPEASPTGIVFLSSFTTKAAVYALVRGFPGTPVLIFLGVFMAIYGIVYAMIENDIRRLLSYHIISQIGYMVAAVGIGTQLALNGAVALAFGNIIYKGLMMMGMSSVLFMTGRRKSTELGGLYPKMFWTFILFMIGGLSISGVPLLLGFVSKSLVVSAAEQSNHLWTYLLLTLVSAGTFISTTLKLPYAVFFGEDKQIPAKDPPTNMLVGMGLAASVCILIGIWPGLLYQLLPFRVEYHPYTAAHLIGTIQILSATALGFLLFLPKLYPENKISLDVDWFYRKGTAAFSWLAKFL